MKPNIYSAVCGAEVTVTPFSLSLDLPSGLSHDQNDRERCVVSEGQEDHRDTSACTIRMDKSMALSVVLK